MSDKIESSLEKAHDNDIYYPSRTVFITGSIDRDMYNTVSKNLHILNNTTGTITIWINSDGGCVIQALAIYDIIRAMKNHVRIIVFGEASSSASFILQAGDERLMMPSCDLMLHLGEECHPSNHPKITERWIKHNKELQKRINKIYMTQIKKKRKRFTLQKLEEMLDFDTILNPNKALEMGLVDKVLDGALE
jgi:ATP-dependent Clp protease protease subunit